MDGWVKGEAEGWGLVDAQDLSFGSTLSCRGRQGRSSFREISTAVQITPQFLREVSHPLSGPKG